MLTEQNLLFICNECERMSSKSFNLNSLWKFNWTKYELSSNHQIHQILEKGNCCKNMRVIYVIETWKHEKEKSILIFWWKKIYFFELSVRVMHNIYNSVLTSYSKVFKWTILNQKLNIKPMDNNIVFLTIYQNWI